jgi:hypothetical protein
MDPERDPSAQNLWKSQEDEPMQITGEEACARALRHQRNDRRVGWALVGLAPLIVAAFVRSLMRLHDPWLIAAMVWALVAFGYFVWISLPHWTRRGTEKPCVPFLRSVLEGKRLWARAVRRGVWLIAPAVAAALWRGGPLLRLKASGVTSPPALRLAGGPIPAIVMGALLATLWLLMMLEERRLTREIGKLGE